MPQTKPNGNANAHRSFGPNVLTQNNGNRLVIVPTGEFSFKLFSLDGKQWNVLEEIMEKF